MTTINTGNIIKLPETLIDPNFTLPLGISDVRYAELEDREPEITEDSDGNTITVLYDEPLDASMLEPPTALVELPPPATATVISQTVYVAADGRFAVDVTLEIEDILGVRDFEVRVSKV